MDATYRTLDLRDVIRRLGAGDLYRGGRAALVPGPGHSKADRSLSLTISGDPPRIVWCSHANDDAGDVWRHLGLDGQQLVKESPADRRRRIDEERRERAMKRDFCAGLWGQTLPASGTLVEAYLRGRGITGAIPKVLRFHPSAPLGYPWNAEPGKELRTHPAMVAIVTGEDGRTAAGLHVTALLPDGSAKAKMKNPRRMFGDVAGGAVQLGALPAGGELGIAEGIETALAYRDLTGTTTWAALSTAGLTRFVAPAGISRLIVAADNDDSGAGISAGRKLAERASRRCEVRLVPAPEGQDWADVLGGRQ